MVAYLTDSEHCTVSTSDREKAWYLFSVLLSIGRPTRLEELAARCTFFHASPDFVEFLCSIPDSPLFLTSDLFVTISLAALSTFEEFASKVIAAFIPRIKFRVYGQKRLWNDVAITYSRKRKGLSADSFLFPTAKRRLFLNDRSNQILLPSASRILNASAKEHDDSMGLQAGGATVVKYDSGILDKERLMSPLPLDFNVDFSSYELRNVEQIEGKNENAKLIVHKELDGSADTPEHRHGIFNIETSSNVANPITVEGLMEFEPDIETALLVSVKENPVLWKEIQIDEMEVRNKTGLTAASCPELVDTQCNASEVEAGIHFSHASGTAMEKIVEDLDINVQVSGRGERDLVDSCIPNGNPEYSVSPDNAAQMDELIKHDMESMSPVRHNNFTISLGREQANTKVESQFIFPLAEPSIILKQPTKSFAKLKTPNRNASTLRLQVPSESLEYNKAVNSPKQREQCKIDKRVFSMKQKVKQSRNHNVHSKEDPAPMAPKNQLEPKILPNFDSFIIEEEEGSGGYGTVYRARRKNDGKTFAIKCPHPNAHRHHVNNELKMLERFGGKNFVIKYEGSFKSGNSECFVLEHVEHDRPEVLKRETDIFQLQWYGFCMFRALASLHKQGVVHRDVKPGNFLFSRKLNKGYLIDFNLAMDVQQKYGASSKSKASCNTSFDHIPLPSAKSAPPTKGKKIVSGRYSEAVNWEVKKSTKSSLEPRNIKKRNDLRNLKGYPDMDSRHILKNQGADGSGITSAKDVTSTRTPSAERLREPLPCQGRKELLSLVQEAMQSPNHDAASVPVSQRKRVAAPPGKMDRKLVYLTPMPLHSTGIAVAGAGLFKNKGDGKNKREGPCVGTKGFRAPEVLFRSLHQGPKVDIWSAGVTILYLMIGRTPFVGDPEQNIKDIAKLRGSEELWEVAKLHNRESSFPVELFGIQALPSTKLKEWCEINSKRPNFLKLIPRSLFDLVDKCLTVNPRLRFSAEDALNHPFFAPCHESLRKQRMLRRGLSLTSESAHVSQESVI